jgi:hypothetical protein
MFEGYIKELLKNLPKRKYNLDVVIEGGAFNGSYVLGILLFLREMERARIVTISKMSGCSVGGLLCFKYLTNNLEDALDEYQVLRKYFYKNQNFNVLNTSVERDIKKLSNEEFLKLKNKKLFLTFHNKESQIVKSNYKDKEDLKMSLLKTAHLPYLINGDCYFKGKNGFFLDGLLPYIFKDRVESANNYILYISPNNLSRLKNIIVTKNEVSVYGRVSEGILDAYSFFKNEKESDMCSFVNKWSISNFMMLRIKHLIILIFLYFVRLMSYFGKNIMPFLRKNELYNSIEPIIKNMCSDLFLHSCF